MAGNSFGNLFRITTFGESHGPAIGVTIDGCPSGIPITVEEINEELARRKPGQSKIVTQRKENDEVEILSGVFEGKTTGTPIALLIRNQDQRSKDYSHIKDTFRPSHADYTYHVKYGNRDYRGGGRSSARETAARVAAGVLAKKLIAKYDVRISAFVNRVKDIAITNHYSALDFTKIEDNMVRCPDTGVAEKMIALIDQTRKNGDTVGGTIQCVIQNCPVGLGEPVFNKLHADLATAMIGINAAQGFEYGSGFDGTYLNGSEHNDAFEKDANGKTVTSTNRSGGVQGGISNGEDIYFNVAFKPVATIMTDQNSIDKEGNPATVKGKGRHDPCVLPRAVPIVEAMAALVIADHLLLNKTVIFEEI